MDRQPSWVYPVQQREAERGNAQAVNWMNSLPPIAPAKPVGWTPVAQSGFTPNPNYKAPAGRPQYIQATRYGNPARPAYVPPAPPPPQSAQQRVVYKIMENKAPQYDSSMPIAANAAMQQARTLNGYAPPNAQANLSGYSAQNQGASLPGYSAPYGGGPGHR